MTLHMLELKPSSEWLWPQPALNTHSNTKVHIQVLLENDLFNSQSRDSTHSDSSSLSDTKIITYGSHYMAPKTLKSFSTYCTPDLVIFISSMPLPLVLLADDVCYLFKLVLMWKASHVQPF